MSDDKNNMSRGISANPIVINPGIDNSYNKWRIGTIDRFLRDNPNVGESHRQGLLAEKSNRLKELRWGWLGKFRRR
jgi:hypothetical protein